MAAIDEQEEFEFRLRAEREAEQSAQVAQPTAQAQPQEMGGLRGLNARMGQTIANVGAGALRGAGSIGATILAPLDYAGVTGMTNEERRTAMDEGLRTMGADTESMAYGGGKLAGEIAGTAGIGGAVGRGVMAGAKFSPTLAPKLAAAIQSGGLTTGAPAARALSAQGVRNAATRIGGGAIAGGAMAGAINPEDVGTGAGIGAALPAVVKGAGMSGKFMRGSPQSPEVINAVKESRDLGYVIPPTQAKPTLSNRLIEGFAGKLTTAQNASARNAEVTNALAAKAIGLPPETRITPEILTDLRKTAGQAYDAIGQTGTITPSANYINELNRIAAPFIKTAQSFPNAKPSPVVDLIESMKSPSFDSAAAVEKIKQLRTAADDAFRSGNTDVARASKAVAKVLEDTVESHLQSIGSPELLKNFRDARQLIAKTYTVEGSLNPTTGSIDAKKLGALLKRGKPLTGELKQAGEFANRFPKAAQTPEGMGSLPQSSPLDWTASGLASFAAGNPLPMAGVLARPATRKLALSDLVQNRLAVNPTQKNKLSDLLENPAARAALISAQSR